MSDSPTTAAALLGPLVRLPGVTGFLACLPGQRIAAGAPFSPCETCPGAAPCGLAHDPGHRVYPLRVGEAEGHAVFQVSDADAFAAIAGAIGPLLELTAGAIGAAEAGFRELSEELPGQVSRHLPDGRLTFANASLRRLLGVTPAQVPDLARERPAHLDLVGIVREVAGSGRPQVHDLDLPELTPPQTHRLHFVPERDAHGEVKSVLTVGWDVTAEIKAARDARALLEHHPDLVSRLDMDLRFRLVSPSLERISGLPPGALLGVAADEVPWTTPETKRLSREVVAHVTATRASATFEAVAEGRTYEVRVVPELDARGEVASLLLIVRDVTDQRAATAQLAKLKQAVEAAPVSIVITDTAGAIEYVNPRFTQVTGYAFDELRGQNPRVLKGGAKTAADYKELWDTVLAGREWRGEFDNRRKNGEHFLERALISPVKGPDGTVTHLIAVKEDVTEQRALEQALRQSQKMEAFGQLAGGVAHDFNNLLTVIQGNLALALDAPPSEARGLLEEVGEAATRAENLTRQLLLFSRRQAAKPEVLDLNDVLANLAKMLRRLLGEHITLVAQSAGAPALVHADRGMLEQVMLNLAVNARDAMPKGGRLEVTATNVVVGAEAAQRPGARPGDFVRLSVTDAGEGITDENLKHLFEPFFTTKQKGRGTGLGLATVFGIVQQHQGWIEVESTLGLGSAFRVFLPRVPAVAPVKAAPMEAERPRGTELVLFVEDDDALRALARRVLERDGYRVLEARTARDAVQHWARHREEIDLLVTDLVLPGLGGRELAMQLQRERPGLRVLFASGHTDDVLGDTTDMRETPGFLEKPFGPKALLGSVRACLDRR